MKKVSDSAVVMHELVLPNDTNVLGNVLGGRVMHLIDICAAMGTSALESAKCSKPTILLDFSYMAIKKGYKYKWIFETEKYNLTEFISRSSHGSGEHSLESILTQFYDDQFVLAQKSYNYYLNNHNIDSIAEKFIKLLDESECTWHDLKKSKVLSRGIIYNLYSVFK